MNFALLLFSRVQLFVTPWTVAHQAPLSMGFSRQEHWNGVPCPSPGHRPSLGIEPVSLALAREGHGTPLQCSCLENPMDRGAWWAAVHGVAGSWTRLSDLAGVAALAPAGGPFSTEPASTLRHSASPWCKRRFFIPFL